ncbi:MAG: thiamine biosynthesis protein ApbE [Flavobacteriaceae bacterium]|nr:thiamine biosynthesis protein ApbE [Flavobacteriaceae bacterium]
MHYLINPFFLFFILIYSSCDSNKLESHIGTALGTSYSIKYEQSIIDRLKVQDGIDSIFFEINNSLSTYIPNSDISRINKGDTTVRVDKHFKRVYNKSKEIWKLTNGYFDPTVGSIVNAYGFGPKKQNFKINSRIIDSLIDGVGFDKLKMTNNNKVLKKYPHTFIDFNAIAKGYTVDCISEYLVSLGSENFLVEIGGEIRAKGINPVSNKKWKIGISFPKKRLKNKFVETYEINDKAIATSGNYYKFLIDSITGEKYVHSINPKNGLALSSNIISVSVSAPSCIVADAFATALMVMPLDMGRKVIDENQNIEATWIISKDKEFVQIKSSGW